MDDEKNKNEKIAGPEDIAQFAPPKKLTRPTAINPDDVDWLFLKKPGGCIDLYEKGDTCFKITVPGEKIQAGIWRALPEEGFWMDLHPESDEFWYIIKGECTFWLPDTKEMKVAKQGEFFYVPAGVRHQSINRTTEELILIFASAPVVSATHH